MRIEMVSGVLGWPTAEEFNDCQSWKDNGLALSGEGGGRVLHGSVSQLVLITPSKEDREGVRGWV